MTATLTITLGDEILKALRRSKSITVALGPGASDGAVRQTRRGGRRAKATRGRRAPARKTGAFRPGSLPARLVAWAGGRKRPFGVQDLVKKFRIRRGHASMLTAYVAKVGAVRRVGRGAYRAA
jgi:hypothetical protein